MAFLLLVAICTISGSFWLVASAMSHQPQTGENAIPVVVAIGVSAIPFLIGIVALAGVGIMLAVNQSRDETVAWIRHGQQR